MNRWNATTPLKAGPRRQGLSRKAA